MNQTASQLYERLKNVKVGASTCLFTPEKCEEIAPLVDEIQALKKEKNAVVLAHSYVAPEILYGVADYVGDSFELSRNAKESTADVIVFSAVKFMAETAKLLNPSKQVLVPSKFNGCSLADSITGDEVLALRQQYPDHTFVCYINTTADVKAACDVCVTSSNVYHIVASIPNDKIYFLPDRLMGQNVAKEMERRGVHKEILYSDGTCYVHEDYDPEMIEYLKLTHKDLEVVSHPECSSGVLAVSDYVGSTSQMINHVKTSPNQSFFLLTECGLISRLQAEAPEKKFIGTCTMCKYMKSNSLLEIRRVLRAHDTDDEIHISPDIQAGALKCLDQMFHYAK